MYEGPMKNFVRLKYIPLISVMTLSACLTPGVLDQAAPVSSALVIAACDPTAAPFGAGDGSSANPFQICSATQLLAVSDQTKNYKLEADLDLTGISFSPIGDGVIGFTGTFDGNSHSISNWTYASSGATDTDAGGCASALESNNPFNIDHAAGFIRILGTGGVVQNLTLTNFTMHGRYYTGAIAGHMLTGSALSNCHATTNGNPANVTTTTTGILIGFNDIPNGCQDGFTGGLVGLMDSNTIIDSSSFDGLVRGAEITGGLVGGSSGVITNSHTTGAVNGRDGNVGGFIGNLGGAGASISDCYSTATFVQDANSGNGGGFIGSVNAGATVTKSYYNGNASGGYWLGGFAGYVNGAGASVTKSYSLGTVSGTRMIAGFAAQLIGGANISDCYTLSAVTFTVNGTGSAGFVGIATHGTLSRVYAAGSVTPSGGGATLFADLVSNVGATGVITDSFSDVNVSTNGLTDTVAGGASITNSSTLTTPNMQTQSSYTGWDFTNVWAIDPAVNNGYPTLR